MTRSAPSLRLLLLLLAAAATTAGCNLDFAERPLVEADLSADSTAPLDTGEPDAEDTLQPPDTLLDTVDATGEDSVSDSGTDFEVDADTTEADAPDISCERATCETLGVECGVHDDLCGATVTCAPCAEGLVCDPTGTCGLDLSPTSSVRIPDTATHLCVGAEDGVDLCPEPGEPFFGQDASYDIRLPAYTPAADTVLDRVTGLTWLRQPVSSLPSAVDAVCPEVTVEGQVDWRLPSLPEVLTLMDYGRTSELYDQSIFGQLDALATRTRHVTQRLYVGATNGIIAPDAPAQVHVLCVRGTWPGPRLVVVDEAAGIAVDRSVALMWTTRTSMQSSWREALLGCESLALGGYDDWRMPTIKELYSLTEHDDGDGARVDTSVFSLAESSELWSATPDGGSSGGWGGAEVLIRTFRPDGDSGAADARNSRAWLCVRDAAP